MPKSCRLLREGDGFNNDIQCNLAMRDRDEQSQPPQQHEACPFNVPFYGRFGVQM
jgi:hypothetical protein